MVEVEVVSPMEQELQGVNPMEMELGELNPAMEELEVSQDMEEDEDEGGMRRMRRRSTTSDCVQFRVWEKQNNQDEVHHHHHHSHDGFKGCSRAASTSGCDIHICRCCCCSSGMIRNHQHHHDTGDHHNAAAELLARSFQLAVSAHDWVVAESLVPFFFADAHRLNDALCIALDSIWFLSTTQELAAASELIERLIAAGAHDFTRATLRTSFLASCVSACRSRTINLADTVTVMAQRLRERLKECNGDEVLKEEAAAKVQRFTEWALKCIGSHTCRRRGGSQSGGAACDVVTTTTSAMHSLTAIESCRQLMAFKKFLDLAGFQLSKKDYTEAFDAACFPLTLFSNAIDPGWATGLAASPMQGLLGLLVERGADNVNQCFLEAARFGSTELVRIFLQIAQRNGMKLDTDLALGFASHYGKIGTMECLVDDGNAEAFLGPLMRAAERGYMEVVQWFVERDCKGMELCLALTAAASRSHVNIVAYLLSHVPHHVLQTLGAEILKTAGERSGGSLQGIAFLLQANFLNNTEATYRIADTTAKSNDEAISLELRAFLRNEWSEEAFRRGRALGEAHYLNIMRVLKRSSSPLHLQELPLQLQLAIAYLPLYRECMAATGLVLSQLLRGQLVEAAVRLYPASLQPQNLQILLKLSKHELLLILASRLPGFLLQH
ncbi:unnamed protein product [Sphagnum troendelagicum]